MDARRTILRLLAETLRKTMTASSGQELDKALADLGWLEMLDEMPETAIPLVFKLLGETGSHAPVLNDVVLNEAGRPWRRNAAAAVRRRVVDRLGSHRSAEFRSGPGTTDTPSRCEHASVPLAAGRKALGWWLVGTSRAMLSLARQHALDRVQFGRPVASFQAIRHRLAETLVAVEGAEATLQAAADDFGSLLAKAAAGQAALTAARHCQQVLGGIGFTAEHELHRHVRRAFLLDGLLGSSPGAHT